MAKKKRKSAIRKTIITTILAMAVLISFSMQTYGATAQNIKISGKTYVYGFNINDSGRGQERHTDKLKYIHFHLQN